MQTINISSLTNEELYRISGALPPERIESLLDCAAAMENATSAAAHIDEAIAQYPAEDFLTGAIEGLYGVMEGMRGERKVALEAVIQQLEQIETDTRNASEYGIEELGKAADCVDFE